MRIIILIAFFCLFFSCKKEESEKILLQGTWIEKSNELDTMIFTEINNKELFELKRYSKDSSGTITSNMLHSGLYEYYLISDDSISIYWTLSSLAGGLKYKFEINDEKDEFIVGNFLMVKTSEIQTSTLTYKKIK